MFAGGYWYGYFLGEESRNISMRPESGAHSTLWNTKCPACGIVHGKHWHIETDLCLKCQEQIERNSMHYKNGRPANNGDVVFYKPQHGLPVVGILHSAVVGNNSCNGRIVIPTLHDPYPNLAECLHIDDVVEKPKAE